MTTEKLTSVFQFYNNWMFTHYGVTPEAMQEEPTGLLHLAYMCDMAITQLIPNGKIEKAMRWLGYIQGVLVCREIFTLEDVKRHSMPDEERGNVPMQ